MASLLQDSLCEISLQAPPPSKDYYHLKVSKEEVVLRVWKVTNPCKNARALPGEDRKSHRELLVDNQMQGTIKRVFGPETLEYIVNLCQQHYDYLVRLPESLIICILSFLSWEDVKSISRTCTRLQQVCNSDGFWEQAERVRCGTGSAPLEGLSPAIQQKLLVFRRRRALLNKSRQQRRKSTTGYF
ncbi:F-box only protein 36-like [Amia ocellicauda]|uniref:F-box only protein 36-like n=1 Tax=Amia ocellicauda TaxID=2972642 RepID=UPI003463F1B4